PSCRHKSAAVEPWSHVRDASTPQAALIESPRAATFPRATTGSPLPSSTAMAVPLPQGRNTQLAPFPMNGVHWAPLEGKMGHVWPRARG
ncbi:unnamed protein product, partial [Bubo scandiacus]